MPPLVSIIVPVYNAEKTLCRCIDSVLAQQYTDFELLLIDDGSTDASGSICDQYAGKDPRVQVVHKPNSGVSNTRNLALELARGTYLQFLDSDDWITPDATSSLVRTAEDNQCDLVVADFYRVVGSRISHKGNIQSSSVLSREEFAAHMMKNPADYYYGVLWNKLYRREIVEQHQLRMAPGISWCEDFMFNLEYIRHAQRFYALPVPIYYYVKTKGSLVSQSVSLSKIIKMKLTVFEYYHQFFKTVLDEEEYERVRGWVYRFLVDAADDGAALPLPGTQKLGKERVQVGPGPLHGAGCICDAYRDRKLLESYLETAALKNDLTLQDALVLLALQQLAAPCTRSDLADLLGVSRSSLSKSLQHLSVRDLIQKDPRNSEDVRKKDLFILFTPVSDPVFRDLDIALADYNRAKCSGLTPEEQQQYHTLNQKIQESAQKLLQS